MHPVVIEVLGMPAEAFEHRQPTALTVIALPRLKGQQHAGLVHLEIDAVGDVVIQQIVRVGHQA